MSDRQHVERRRVQYMTREQFVRWRRAALVGYVLVFVLSGVGLWRTKTVGDDSTDKVADSTATASLQSCYAGKDLRIVAAASVDKLRRGVVDRSKLSDREYDDMLEATQPAVDLLLTQAAGRVVVTAPAAPLDEATKARVREDGRVACLTRTRAQFGILPPPDQRRLPDQ